ncbi:MAG: alpha/beta hydrolase [Propionibacteriaceae bacterium]|jgi:pimeloyl-ACP methyl ester carboxylesterase|nr:alpha/beta hydrolase [Propionibacteriaceae bacterium]
MAEATRPTLLLLHGPGQNPTAWQSVVGYLNPEWPMFAPWIKGLKPIDKDDFAMATAVADLGNLFEMRGIEQADLVGYSIGGAVALHAAAEFPEIIRHLVLVSTPVVPSVAQLKMTRRMMAFMPPAAFDQVPKELVLRALDALMESDLTTDLDRVTTPTLVVTAQGDPAAQAALALFEDKDYAHLVTLDSPTPDLLSSAPEQLAQAITEFVA